MGSWASKQYRFRRSRYLYLIRGLCLQDASYIAATINGLSVDTTINLRCSSQTEKSRFPVNLRRVERLIGLRTPGIKESNARKILQAFIKKFLAK